MILVLLNWCLMTLNFLGWGLIFYQGMHRWLRFPLAKIAASDLMLCGVLILMVLCNALSLLMPVNGGLLWVFTPIAIGAGWHWRAFLSGTSAPFKKIFQKKNICFVIAGLLLFVIAMIKTTGPCEIEDEAGYHLPLVRWTETYGLVPGMANIEDRMGFNPAVYVLNAVFNLRHWVPGGSFDLNSFLFLVIGMGFLRRFKQFWEGQDQHWIAAFFSVAALVFLFRTYLSAMDADFLNIFGGLYLLLLVVENVQKPNMGAPLFETAFIPLWWLTLVSNKFSIFLLGPIIAWGLLVLLKNGQKGFVVKVLIVGTGLVSVWMARNFFISGYLIYPLYFLDIFEVDWKVPLQLAQGQYAYVAEFARLELARPFNTYVIGQTPLSEWWGPWLERLWGQLIGKVVLIGGPLALIGVLLKVVLFAQWRSANYRNLNLWGLLLLAVLLWWLRIPAVRFAWPWLLAFLVLSFVLLGHGLVRARLKAFKYLLMCLLLLSLLRSSVLSVLEFPQWAFYWYRPYPIDEGAAQQTLNWQGNRLRVAPDNFCRGIEPPCLPLHYHPQLQLRTNRIQDGFKIAE